MVTNVEYAVGYKLRIYKTNNGLILGDNNRDLIHICISNRPSIHSMLRDSGKWVFSSRDILPDIYASDDYYESVESRSKYQKAVITIYQDILYKFWKWCLSCNSGDIFKIANNDSYQIVCIVVDDNACIVRNNDEDFMAFNKLKKRTVHEKDRRTVESLIVKYNRQMAMFGGSHYVPSPGDGDGNLYTSKSMNSFGSFGSVKGTPCNLQYTEEDAVTTHMIYHKFHANALLYANSESHCGDDMYFPPALIRINSPRLLERVYINNYSSMINSWKLNNITGTGA